MRRYYMTSTRTIALLGILTLSNCAVAQEPFPNINNAEASLYSALDSLHQAPPRFAGHKEEAVRLIQQAIGELEAAKQSFH